MEKQTRYLLLEKSEPVLKRAARFQRWPSDKELRTNLRAAGNFFFADLLTTHEVREGEHGRELVIAGYANTKNLDRYLGVIEPTAFEGSVEYWASHGVVLKYHNSREPLAGAPFEASIDKEGLWIQYTMTPMQREGDRFDVARYEFENRLLPAHSVGFMTYYSGDIEWNDAAKEGDHQFKVKSADLLETSLVSIPANRESLADFAYGMALGIESPQFKRYRKEIQAMRSNLADTLRAARSNQLMDEAQDEVAQMRSDLLSLRV